MPLTFALTAFALGLIVTILTGALTSVHTARKYPGGSVGVGYATGMMGMLMGLNFLHLFLCMIMGFLGWMLFWLLTNSQEKQPVKVSQQTTQSLRADAQTVAASKPDSPTTCPFCGTGSATTIGTCPQCGGQLAAKR